MVGLLLLLLILFAGLFGYLFYQLGSPAPAEGPLFLPVGGEGKLVLADRLAISERSDGSAEWIAWEMGAAMPDLPPLPDGWQVSFPDSLLPGWARTHRELQVVAGQARGYFYRVVLDLREPDYQAIGFFWSDRKPYLSDRVVVTTVDSVEQVTGLDFFADFIAPGLQDSLENEFSAGPWEGLPDRSQPDSDS